MEQVLIRIRDVDSNNSDAVKEVVNKFFQLLAKDTCCDRKILLFELKKIINRFPKYCMSHRLSIEAYLKKYLDCENYFTVVAVAKCAHALQQVRPPKDKTATEKCSWKVFLLELCSAANSLIDVIFKDAIDIHKAKEVDKDDSPEQSVLSTALAKLCTMPQQNKMKVWCTRLKNVFVFIQAMLVEVYPFAKPVVPHAILSLTIRALTVSNVKKQDQDIETIKTQALRTTDALVICLGSNLIPYSPLVIRAGIQTLRWSTDNPTEESRRVRMGAYGTLRDWLYVLHAHGAGKHAVWQEALADFILSDITPTTRTVKLTVNAKYYKLSKRIQKKLANTRLQDSAIISHVPDRKKKLEVIEEIGDDPINAALNCAEAFLTVCGLFLKPSTHEAFHERLIQECYSLELYSSSRALCLLRVLEACRKSVPPSVPPPTQYCLQLYSDHLSSGDREIAKFCSQALLDIRMHLHCSPSSLNFAAQVPQDKNQPAEDKPKTISERNRATLKALLGSAKITVASPEEDDEADADSQEEENQTDEPDAKKPRLEEVADEISLSSDSAQPIEINDEGYDEEDSEDDVQLVMAIDAPDNQSEASNESAESNIYEATTQIPTEAKAQEPTKATTETLAEPITLIPTNASNEAVDDEVNSPKSLEVGYDYPDTGKENISVLDKIEDENLPSTNDTDDVQITCGQVVKCSQDVNSQKNKDDLDENSEAPVTNSCSESSIKSIQNATVSEEETTTKIAVTEGVSVEDMMADFVDEVAENISEV